MNKEELRRLAIRIPELRKKELLHILNETEELELQELVKADAEAYPTEDELPQYARNVEFTAVRNYEFEDVTPKPALLKKMFNKEVEKEYELIAADGDLDSIIIPFAMARTIPYIMKEAGLAAKWPDLLPVDYAIFYKLPLDEEEKQWFATFPDPSRCAAVFQQSDNLFEKALAYSEEMSGLMKWLQKHWEEGYQIFADFDPAIGYEWD